MRFFEGNPFNDPLTKSNTFARIRWGRLNKAAEQFLIIY